MSLLTIRRAFEKRLAAMVGALPTAYENATFTPVVNAPYQRVNLLPATPGNEIMGDKAYFENGLFQITALYPQGVGPAAADAYAQSLRLHFKRGTTMTESGIDVVVTDTPRVAPPLADGDRYLIPISVPFQAQILT